MTPALNSSVLGDEYRLMANTNQHTKLFLTPDILVKDLDHGILSIAKCTRATVLLHKVGKRRSIALL
jgi:hypothetical protein